MAAHRNLAAEYELRRTGIYPCVDAPLFESPLVLSHIASPSLSSLPLPPPAVAGPLHRYLARPPPHSTFTPPRASPPTARHNGQCRPQRRRDRTGSLVDLSEHYTHLVRTSVRRPGRSPHLSTTTPHLTQESRPPIYAPSSSFYPQWRALRNACGCRPIADDACWGWSRRCTCHCLASSC